MRKSLGLAAESGLEISETEAPRSIGERWDRAEQRVRLAEKELREAIEDLKIARKLVIGKLRTQSGAQMTAREQELLGLISVGQADKEIAAALGISLRTVKFHVSNLLRKFAVASRYELRATVEDGAEKSVRTEQEDCK